MKSIIDHELPILEKIGFSNNQISNSVNFIYTISNFHTAFYSLEKLEKIALFSTEIKQLLSKYPFLSTNRQSFNVEKAQYSDIESKINNLAYNLTLTSNILAQIVDEQDPHTISFKLFEFENFGEYTEFCNDLNVRILNPINRLKIDVKLGELEAGSKWVSIVFGTAVGISLFASITRQSFDILIHDYQKYQAAQNVINSLKLERELLETYTKGIAERVKEENAARSSSIMSELQSHPDWETYSKTELPELENSVRISMEVLSKYIDKGLEVYQALDVEEKDRYKLPDYKELLQLKESEKPQKLLE
jgi:hypothetical protein